MLRDLRHRFSGLCGHGSCAAQYEQSAVSGTVPDLQAGPIPHVRIQIQHAETGLMRSTLSSSSGVFVLSGLPLGEYTLVASHEGFGEARLRGIRLSVSQTQSIDVTMKLAARAEDVAVTAKLGEVDQASAAFGTRMERDLVNRLPAQRPELGLDAPAACRGDRSGTFIREVCALAGMAATQQLHSGCRRCRGISNQPQKSQIRLAIPTSSPAEFQGRFDALPCGDRRWFGRPNGHGLSRRHKLNSWKSI